MYSLRLRRATAAATLIGACLSLLCWTGHAWAVAREGDSIPAFALTNVETGAEAAPAELVKGTGAALVFMQTSCAACRQELLALKDLQAKHSGLKVVAICVDTGPAIRVQRYKEHFAFEFVFLHDPDFKTPELFGFSFTPGLVLVDSQGKINLIKGGYAQGDEAALEQGVQNLWKRHD